MAFTRVAKVMIRSQSLWSAMTAIVAVANKRNLIIPLIKSNFKKILKTWMKFRWEMVMMMLMLKVIKKTIYIS